MSSQLGRVLESTTSSEKKLDQLGAAVAKNDDKEKLQQPPVNQTPAEAQTAVMLARRAIVSQVIYFYITHITPPLDREGLVAACEKYFYPLYENATKSISQLDAITAAAYQMIFIDLGTIIGNTQARKAFLNALADRAAVLVANQDDKSVFAIGSAYNRERAIATITRVATELKTAGGNIPPKPTKMPSAENGDA